MAEHTISPGPSDASSVVGNEKPKTTIPLAVYLLGLSLFAMGSAEFLMGGILPKIAEDLQISLPTAGTLISAFAVGALIGAPPLAIMTLHWPRRATLFLSQAVFVAATAFSLVSEGYLGILIARFVMGLAYACFWAVAASTAVQLVASDRRAKALSVVVSGLTVAMVLGGPAGTFISELTGWRGGFWAVVAATTVAAIAILLVLPARIGGNMPAPDTATELRAMKRPVLWVAYATTAATTAAYMGTFGYMGALLLDVSGLPLDWLPAVLSLFGLGAFLGLTIGGRTADRHPFSTLISGIAGLILVSGAIAFFASHMVAIVILVFLLGVVGFILNPAVWGRVYIIAPDAPTLAGAINSSAFQLGLTVAPVLGGLPISYGHSVASVGWTGAVLGVLALFLAFIDQRMSHV
ncbi:Cmx/CmrA family chloramphenicol efflux MFS transporter [Brucella intermedia]|uniref:Cmx/CmrA family chloramphenicol efflux MFS transporter n=1 Tax=Brucella intermedia TaxID=94625 RepID=UPI00224AB9A1|nr:Cmx/CmrA family chloramphenicol efflux MFS transporter [Brucella intermedia]